MPSPNRAERIAFWKHSYARSSFIQADGFSKLLLRHNPPPQSFLRTAITFGVITAYARPFKQRVEVKLSSDVVPAEYRQLHDETIQMRDKIIAHRDLTGPIAEWGLVSQVQVVISGTEVEVNTLSPIFRNERAEQMLPLFAALIALMEEKIRPFFHYFSPPPTSGRYIVSLDDEPAEWLRRFPAPEE